MKQKLIVKKQRTANTRLATMLADEQNFNF